MPETLSILAHWWLEGRLLRERDRHRWQARREKALERHLSWVAARSPAHAGRNPSDLGSWPATDKAGMMESFSRLNTRGLDRDLCLETALRAERERDFLPTLDGVTVGLSSGTSGNRGLFLASAAERRLWAGVLLRRMLPDLLAHRHRAALFLRSDSNLYRTVRSPWLEFQHYDLYRPFPELVARLARQNPTFLAAPPSVLDRLAEVAGSGVLRISPRRVVSVAEVLDDDVSRRVETAFGTRVDQIYQCTEGLLATTCGKGTLHLHEEHVWFETEWLDAERTRFQPVVTDFRRRTQPIVRYRLNDILVPGTCDCGSLSRAISRIEGRSDDCIRAVRRDGSVDSLFPDFLRRLVLETLPDQTRWRIEQASLSELRVLTPSPLSAERLAPFQIGLEALCRSRGLSAPTAIGQAWTDPPPGAKLRRVVGLSP